MVGRRFGRGTLPAFAAVAALLLAVAPGARAGFTITLQSVSGSGPYTYDYTADTSVGDAIEAGNFFRIYDFYGYVPGSISAPAGWTVTTELVTAVPPPNVILSLGDDPAIPNLIFTYNGPRIGGAVTLTGFRATSLYQSFGNIKNFVGRSTQADGGTAGQPVDVVGNVRVPAIPEPSAALTLGIGLAGLLIGGIGRRRA